MIDEKVLCEDIKRLIVNDPIIHAVWTLANITNATTLQFLENCVLELAEQKAAMQRAEIRRLENEPSLIFVGMDVAGPSIEAARARAAGIHEVPR